MVMELQKIHAGYGRTEVLHGIDLALREGERVAILGANGSGKTTLLRTMAGVLPYTGSLQLMGQEIRHKKRREIASVLAMMMQVSQTYFSYSVEETVMLGRYVRSEGRFGRATAADLAAVETVLSVTGLSDCKDRPVSSLSGGQLQRVFLARTLAQETPIILLDEPTNHLDLKIQSEIMSHLNRWAQEEGHTLIGVYHDINLALSMADRLVVMQDGRILAEGERDAVMQSGALEAAYEMDVAAYMRRQYARWK